MHCEQTDRDRNLSRPWREVQESILSEISTFPVDKVAVGDSPSVAMHVPLPLLRASPSGQPRSVEEMAAASIKAAPWPPPPPAAAAAGAKAGGGAGGGGREGVSESADEGGTLVPLFPVWEGWTQPSVALTLRTVLMTVGPGSAFPDVSSKDLLVYRVVWCEVN